MHPGNVVSRLEFANATPTFTVAARTATTNGSTITTTDHEGLGLAILMCGAVSGTSPTLDVKIQDSPDGTTWTDVSGGAFTQITGGSSIQKLNLDFNSLQKNLRAVATIAGTSPSFTFGVQFLGLKKVASA
jgi:hypothetical protein